MSIQLNEESNGKLLVIHVSDKLVKADYERFVSEVERLVRQRGKLRMLFDMTRFQGWDVGAAWEDFKFGVEHFADIERLAIFCKPLTKAQVRYFDHAKTSEARKWLEQA